MVDQKNQKKIDKSTLVPACGGRDYSTWAFYTYHDHVPCRSHSVGTDFLSGNPWGSRACVLSSQPLARARVARLPGLGLYCRLHPIPQTDVGCSRTPSADNAALTEGEKNLPRCICRYAFSLLPFFLSSSPPPHLLCFFDKVARNKEGKKERRKKNPQKPHTQPC